MSADLDDDGPPTLQVIAVRGVVALLGALLINGVIVAGIRTGGLVEPFRPLAIPPVATFTAVGVVGATVVYAVVSRLVDDYDRTYTFVAGVVLLLSFVPDAFLLGSDPSATVPAVVVLAALHVTTAVVCVVSLVDLQARPY